MQTAPPSYRKQPPKLLGGILCLDFVNTVSWRGDPQDRGERLTGYVELVHWAAHAGVLDARAARRLLAEAERRPAAAQALLTRAIEFREALVSLVLPGKRTSAASLAIVNDMLASAPPRSEIRARGQDYDWGAGAGEDALESPLHPVVWSAADLLTSGRRTQVRRCRDERCSWHFLDTSPTGRRAWCSMKECGNRAKVRRHHQRSTASERSR